MSDPILATPYEQSDFSGGFTDNYFSNDPTKCARNDNCTVDNNHKLVQRPGSMLFSVTSGVFPTGVQRISRLFKFVNESLIFGTSKEQVYYRDDPTDSWLNPTAPFGYTSTGYTEDTKYSVAEWQGHLLLANDSGSPPSKIYSDATGAIQYRTAGLPMPSTPDNFVTATATASLIALANDLRTHLISHMGAVDHFTSDATDIALVAAAATDLTTLITLTNSLIQAYKLHNADLYLGANKYHYQYVISADYGPAPQALSQLSDMLLAQSFTATTIYDVAPLLNDLRKCYLTHVFASVAHASVTSSFPVAAVYGVNKGAVANLSWQPYYDWFTRVKAQYNAHLANGTGVNTAHSTAADATNTLTDATPATPDAFADSLIHVRAKYSAHEADAALGAAWAFHVATESTTHALQSNLALNTYYDTDGGILAGNFSAMVTQINNIASQMNAHTADLTAHYTVNPSPPYHDIYVIPGTSWVLASYAYAIVYSRTYTVGGVTFEDVSAPYYFAADRQLSVQVTPISITGIPNLDDSATSTAGNTNYADSNTVVKIYRTTDGGTVYFYVGQVANGTTTYTDSTTDTELQSNDQLYTTGGVVANDRPPISRCVHIVNSTGYYGYITEGTAVYKNRIRQSIVGDFDSCPGSFYDDLDDEVVGISSSRTVPLVLGKTGIYRLEGVFDLQGNGGINHVAIHNPDSIGCISENSIVRVDQGVFFAGTDGFYFTDGYQLQKVSLNWNTTYRKMTVSPTRQTRISGTYDKTTKRVYWTAQTGDASSDNDTLFCLDLNQNFPQNNCWSTWSNGRHFSPTALLMYQGNLLRADALGYIFQHHEDYTEDAYINTAVAVGSWGTKAIVIDFKSCASDLGMGPVRKMGFLCTFNLKNESNVSQQVISINDDGHKTQSLSPIRSLTHITWGDPFAPNWGVPNIIWNFKGNLSLKRRFAAKGLRFTYKQMELTNNFIRVKSSGTTPGTATVSAAAQTVTLDTLTNKWPPDLEGYFIKFSGDSYTASFEILSRTSDTVLALDHSPEVLLDGSQSWEIWGYPKYEKFHLLSHAVHAIPLSTSQLATKTDVVGGVDS